MSERIAAGYPGQRHPLCLSIYPNPAVRILSVPNPQSAIRSPKMVNFIDHLPSGQMHAQDLVELAAIVAAHGELLVESRESRLTDKSLENYWSASKCRLDRWGSKLKELQTRKSQDKAAPQRALVLIEEIFASEALTRVWTAAATAYDQQRDSSDATAIVTSVLNGQSEARHRALRLLADAPVVSREDAMRLTRLHRRVGRWIDLLVAYLQRHHEVSRFAIQQERCRDFAADLLRQSDQRGGRHTWRLTFSSLRQTLCRELLPHSPNADLNFKIGASILSCFDTNAFESVGALRSLWLIRLLDTSTHCEAMVRDLLGE
jgi:hypothetical protein